MEQLFTCTGLLLCISMVSAQLTYHLDANTNSYTLQTPNSQQTFTQHFNTRSGAANSNQIQAAQSQPQQQIFSTSPQQFASNQNNDQEEINNYFRQQLELQQQQRQSEQNQYTTYQASQQQQQQQPQQQQRQSSQDLGIYLQQIQQAQLQQQQQQQQLQEQQQQQQEAEYPTQQPFAYQQPSAGFNDNRGAAQFAQFQPQTVKYQQQQAATNNLLGTHFSPSNEVSHVKFSSGDSSYNF